MNRREFLCQAGWGAAALAGCAPLLAAGRPAHAAANRPNIVLIMADDLGYAHLGCYGQEHIRTPHIDRLAAEGMRFTQCYSGAPLCAPARSVLMTGLHGGHTPVRGNTGGIALPDGYITPAEVLKNAGYRTGLFGKWGLGDADTEGVPNRQGFDEFFGYLHQKHAHFYYTDYLWHNEERHLIPENRGPIRTVYTHDLFVERGLDFIRENKDNPFFCFLSFTIPHHEWAVPEDSMAPYEGLFDETPPEFRWRQGYALPEKPKTNMAGMISRMDDGVGQVMALLKELGLDDNTLVIFTSDNGADRYSLAEPEFFEANGPLREFKGTLYEGGIRVPGIARWTGTIPAGTESDLQWSYADFLPTCAELAGAQTPPGLDGISIAPALLGTGAQTQHEFLYWENWGENVARACRVGDWKAVWPSPAAPIELYNLAEDLGETTNIAQAQSDTVAQLRAIMEREHQAPPPQIEPNAPDGRQHR